MVGVKGMHKGRQKGAGNNNFKGGHSIYRKRQMTSKQGRRCAKCGSRMQLEVHHRDTNRKHGASRNLQTLCRSCHQRVTPNKGRFKGGNRKAAG